MMPDPDTRQETADAIRALPGAELVDFTRDVYGTMYVTVDGEETRGELEALASDAGYEVLDRAAADRVVLEARSRAPEKVSMGGNRL